MISTSQKINDFSDLFNQIDTFFLDMYGVLWNGTDFYENALNTLEKLKQFNKKICIISNMTTVHTVFCASKAPKGLIQGVHFDQVVTSGDICKAAINNHLFESLSHQNDFHYYVLGENNPALFESIAPHETKEISKADVVYFSGLGSQSFESFLPELKTALQKKLPAVCANPDVFFMQNNQKLPAQGLFADYYQKHGGKVTFFGKPYPLIFETALLKMKADKNKTLMAGDMLTTDIQGAVNAGLKSVLITGTGVTAEALKNGETLDNILNRAKIYPSFIKDTFADD